MDCIVLSSSQSEQQREPDCGRFFHCLCLLLIIVFLVVYPLEFLIGIECVFIVVLYFGAA